jgi:signal transduction histidine kinase
MFGAVIALGRRGRTLLRKRSFAMRMPRRHAATAWRLAVFGPALIAVGAREAGSAVPPASMLFCTLLVILAVALIGGVRPALAAVAIGIAAQELLFGLPYGSLADHEPAQLSVLVAFVVVGAVLGVLVDNLTELTEEQAALRRIALLVAGEVPTEELFTAVTEEVTTLLRAEFAGLDRYEHDNTVTFAGGWDARGSRVTEFERVPLGGRNIATLVAATGRPARIDDYVEASGPVAGIGLQQGVRSAVGVPVSVEGRLWGVMIAGTNLRRPLHPDTEERLARFTELLATAIANAESRAAVTASRRRVIAAGDETRRRIERDLHDGIQQRLVSLGLDLVAARAAVPRELGELKQELSRAVDGLVGVQHDLREIARGIHPAILAEGGLEPALKILARRSPVPVELEVNADRRLPERLEVATYFIVSEALANAAKHASASVVQVGVETVGAAVRISVRDDGVGGANPGRGSSLVGLTDRVEALGGALAVQSPHGAGTSVQVELPLGG